MIDLRDDILKADRADTLMAMEVGIAGVEWRNHAATLGIASRPVGSATAFIAPQSEWPHTMMSRTPSASTAYSTVEDTPPFCVAKGGTMFPALRQTNRSPGCACMMSSGTTRESAQEIISALGLWPWFASLE
jgi:hypothetical protein